MKTFLRCVLLALTLFSHAFAAPVNLKLITPAGYLTNIPVLVRIEALDANGAPDRELWDADVSLSASAGFTLSTNRIILRNVTQKTIECVFAERRGIVYEVFAETMLDLLDGEGAADSKDDEPSGSR